MSSDFLDSFLDDYYAECEEHLAVIRRGLLNLEASIGQPRPDAVLIEELFRSFHSIKGIAGMVEHRESELLAHEMESYLRVLREGEARLTTHGVETLITGVRALEHSIAAHRAKQSPPDDDAVLANLRALATEPSEPGPEGGIVPVAEPLPAWKCIFTPSPELAARGVNVDVVRARLRGVGDILRSVPLVMGGGAVAFEFIFSGALDHATIKAWRADGMACTAEEGPIAPVEEPSAAPGGERRAGTAHGAVLSSGHYVRVDLAKLDDLMRMIGDLVIMRARLVEALTAAEPYVPPTSWRNIQETTAGIERQLRELREGVMRVRLVPVGEIFRRMPFVVRDLARDTGRRVRVDVSGQDTQIDKFLVERMMDPVLHLVRNAVSHGMESADERIAAGKSPEGVLGLRASASGEIVTIEIADDGRGVDSARVLARAREAGLPVPTVVDDAALLDLICSPGFSTREESDRGSGRGFGMAVVRLTVQELGGSLRMWTEQGRGTTFSVELPLTLAIIDALIARVGSQTFAVPQSTVREVMELNASLVRSIEGGEVVPYRGVALPLVRLSSALGVRTSETARLHVFVIGTGMAAVGLVADQIVGQREIVVRSTVDPLIRVQGIAGATDLGDGRVVLILDAPAIARSGRRSGGNVSAGAASA
jgi:two-component system chemotaxis sensor kinase CheA